MFRAIVVFITFFTVSGVFASNFNFIHDSAPISDFNKKDIEMLEGAIQKALDMKKDGEKLVWKNEKTGNSGLVNPILTLDQTDDKCRNVRIINKSKKNIAESKFKFCKINGKWLAVKMLNE